MQRLLIYTLEGAPVFNYEREKLAENFKSNQKTFNCGNELEKINL